MSKPKQLRLDLDCPTLAETYCGRMIERIEKQIEKENSTVDAVQLTIPRISHLLQGLKP